MTTEFLLNLLFYIIITPIISLTLTKIMYMSENKMIVADALSRIDSVLDEDACVRERKAAAPEGQLRSPCMMCGSAMTAGRT